MLDEKLIFLDVEVADRDELFRFYSRQLRELGYITSEDEFIASLYEREEIGSTYMLNGIAIPHGKSASITKPFLGMAKLKKPIIWNQDCSDDEGEEGITEVAFFIGVPIENPDNIHLQIIGSICRKLSDDDLLNALKQETSASQIAAMLY